jgi:hypothetical protein
MPMTAKDMAAARASASPFLLTRDMTASEPRHLPRLKIRNGCESKQRPIAGPINSSAFGPNTQKLGRHITVVRDNIALLHYAEKHLHTIHVGTVTRDTSGKVPAVRERPIQA